MLLGFEENNIVTTIDIISRLYSDKDKYDMTKSFNKNLSVILKLNGDTIWRTHQDKEKFVKKLMAMDRENKLAEYISNGIKFFNEIYQNENNIVDFYKAPLGQK